MARGRPRKAAPVAASEISKEDLKRVVGEVQRHKNSASEYAGYAGQAAKTAIERHSLDRKAFSFVAGLSKMDAAKRQTTLRSVLEYAHKLDMFADVDAFDNILDRMDEITAEVRDRGEKGRPADPVISTLVN